MRSAHYYGALVIIRCSCSLATLTSCPCGEALTPSHLYCGPSYSLVLFILQALDHCYADISWHSSIHSCLLFASVSIRCQAFDLSLPPRRFCCLAVPRRSHTPPRPWHWDFTPPCVAQGPSDSFIYERLRHMVIYGGYRDILSSDTAAGLRFFPAGVRFPHILWWAYFLVDVFIEQAGHTGSPAYVLYIAMDRHTMTWWT